MDYENDELAKRVKMREINILIDFYTNLGNTSKLVKYLKDKGFSPRQTSYDSIRLRLEYPLSQVDASLLEKINAVLKTISETNNIWNTCCIEVWIEEENQREKNIPRVEKHGDLCIYIRPGSRGRIIRKLVWIAICSGIVKPPLPESTMRKCIENSRAQSELKTISETIEKFTSIYIHR